MIYAARRDVSRLTPDRVENLRSRNDVPRVLNEQEEEAELDWSEIELTRLLIAFAQVKGLAARKMNLDRALAKNVLHRLACSFLATFEFRVHANVELDKIEWLRNIVPCAEGVSAHASWNGVRPKMIETTSAGAAYLAALGAGVFSDLSDIKKVWKAEKTFAPKMSSEARAQRLERWSRAIARAKG